MLKLINDKINEVLKANNITRNDLDPWDSMRLGELENALKELIKRTISYQHKEIPTSSYVYLDSEGIIHTVEHNSSDSDIFFSEISRRIAFADCSNEEIVTIFWRGEEVQYAGWKSGMRFEYIDSDGNTVWSGEFPEWNH